MNRHGRQRLADKTIRQKNRRSRISSQSHARKTDAQFCCGHNWVVAALVITHTFFGEISFPMVVLVKQSVKKFSNKNVAYSSAAPHSCDCSPNVSRVRVTSLPTVKHKSIANASTR